MAIVTKVFVSATSADLGSFRRELAATLRMARMVPVVQDDWGADYRSVEQIVRSEIEQCDAVICLIGEAYGAEPRNRPDDAPRRSYTQIEYHVARQLGKPIYHFLSADGCEFDKKIQVSPEPVELKELQEAHRTMIRGTDPKRDRFQSLTELLKLVASIRFPDLPQEVPRPERFRIGRLPTPGNDALFVGRDQMISTIEAARTSGESRIMMLHGFGGVGKTTVLWHWLRELERSDYHQLPQAFDWSFYRQGTDTGGKVSSRAFLEDARRHFRRLGCEFLDKASPDHLGDEVAWAFLRVGGLMVLDGMEPLQNQPNVHGGACLDQEFSDFLHALARHGTGLGRQGTLLVLSSRWLIPSLGPTFRDIPVTALSVADGGRLLREFRGAGGRRLTYTPSSSVTNAMELEPAKQVESESAAVEFGCQPLALVLLATYLLERHGGELALWSVVRKGDEITTGSADQAHRHARRVMDEYAKMFDEQERAGTEGELYRACRRVLRLVGLFDRPADRRLIDVVRGGDTIPGLTDGLRESAFRNAAIRLRELHLLALGDDDQLDAHPLIRERFASQFRQEEPDSWTEAHSRLFRHLSTEPPTGTEADDVRFERLSQAVAHGCRAADFRAAATLYLGTMLGDEIGRDNWKKLASMGDDLAALSHFFEVPWYGWQTGSDGRLAADAIGDDAGEILNESGFDLFKLCRFSEAERAFEKAVSVWTSAGNLRNAARDTVLLGKARVALGKLEKALGAGWEAMAFTKPLIIALPPDSSSLSPDELALQKMPRKERMNALFFLGEAHHHLGQWEAAEAAFRDAIASEDEYHKLFKDDIIYTVRVFQHGNFLLDRGDLAPLEARVTRAQTICERNPRNHRQDMAYNDYLLGRMHIHRGLAMTASRSTEFDEAQRLLERFLKACWDLSMTDGRLIAHLALAELAFATGDVYSCERHLADAWELCEPPDVRRFRCECLIEWARFHLWRGHPDRAREPFDRASVELVKMGYFRRASQLRAIAAEAGWPAPSGLPPTK